MELLVKPGVAGTHGIRVMDGVENLKEEGGEKGKEEGLEEYKDGG